MKVIMHVETSGLQWGSQGTTSTPAAVARAAAPGCVKKRSCTDGRQEMTIQGANRSHEGWGSSWVGLIFFMCLAVHLRILFSTPIMQGAGKVCFFVPQD